MSKKWKGIFENDALDVEENNSDAPAQELVGNFPTITEDPSLVVKRYYEKATWKGVKDVFKCLECGECRDDESEGMSSIILHVITHVPENEREALFYKLIGEKNG